MMDLFSQPGVISLRPYQDQATDAVIRALKEPGISPIICAATGTGKSVIIASLVKRIRTANPGARIMVATHVAELLEQNAGKLRAISPHEDIGFYSAQLGRKESGNAVVFAGIQSVFRCKDLGKFNVLIVDEVHTISRKDKSMWASLLATLREANPSLRMVGLSATPFRLDSGSLVDGDEALFTDIVFDYSLGRAIQDGYLCNLIAKHTTTEYKIDGVGKVAGEYNLKELEAATNVDSLTQRAVSEMITKAGSRRSWLIFCNGVAHSFAIRDEIRRHGIVAETVTGETPEDERDRILREFKSGRIRAVTNNAVWTTGIDVPGVDVIGMFRHTMSGGLLLQMAGRGTRATIDLNSFPGVKERKEAIAASNKPHCLFLDFAGNIERHGFLDQIKAKEKGKKGDGVAPMKFCPECATICHAAAKTCKDCGYVFPVNEETKLNKAYDGSLLSAAEELDVVSVEYFPHNLHKEGKTPSLMVKYNHPSGDSTKEWVCIQHEGFAGQKAAKWWKDRSGPGIDGCDVKFITDNFMCDVLKIPRRIVRKKEGKFFRIIRYLDLEKPSFVPDRTRSSYKEEMIESAMEEIPW